MRDKTLLILAAIAIPVTVLALVLPGPQATTLPKLPGGALMLPDLKTKIGQATSMIVAGPDGKITLHRAGTQGAPADGWVLADKDNYPVAAAKIKPVLDGLETLRTLEVKTSRPALYSRLDLGDAGPGSQSHQISLLDSKNTQLATIVLGRTKDDTTGAGHDRIYARVPGHAETWLAEPAINLPSDMFDWIDKTVVDLDPDKIKQITITQTTGGDLTLTRAKAGDKFTVQNMQAGDKLKSDTAGNDIAAGFQDVELSDVKAANRLSGTKVATAQATTFDGVSVTLDLTKDGGQTWATLTASGPKPAPDISARTKGWAYAVPDAKATELESKRADILATPTPTPPPVKR
jgi:hypothetical protein